jgi:hypothetical protein
MLPTHVRPLAAAPTTRRRRLTSTQQQAGLILALIVGLVFFSTFFLLPELSEVGPWGAVQLALSKAHVRVP